MVANEIDWLWAQVKNFAGQGKLNPTVLMVLEPEKSKAAWEVWVEQGTNSTPAALIKQKARLLMATARFDVKGYLHCSFVLRWFINEHRMESVVGGNQHSRDPYARLQLVACTA